MERCTAAHVSTSLTKVSMETDGAINTTWAEDVTMSVWQRKTKEIQGKFSLKSQDKMEGKNINTNKL